MKRAATSAEVPFLARQAAFEAACAASEAGHDLGIHALASQLSPANCRSEMLTYAKIAAIRDNIMRQWPKSAAGDLVQRLVDAAIPGMTASERDAYLLDVSRVASVVVDQKSYEAAVEHYGLAGDDIASIHARGLIRALAQLDMPEHEEGLAPHDEASETLAEATSPNTGEPLVIELAPKSPEGPVPAGEESQHMNKLMPLEEEGPFSQIGQLSEFAPSDASPSAPEHNVVVTLDDPTAPGKQIDVILEPHETEEDLESMSDDDFDLRVPMDEHGDMLPESPDNGPRSARWRPYTVIAATESAVSRVAQFKARSMSSALRRVAALFIRRGEADALAGVVLTATRPEARGKYSIVDFGDSQLHVVASDAYDVGSGADAQHDMQGAVPVPAPEKVLSDAEAGEGSNAKTARLSVADVQTVANSIGLSAAVVETKLLDGTTVERNGWRITLTASDEIELGPVGKKARRVPLRSMDEAIGDFQAVVAALEPKTYTVQVKVPGDSEDVRRVNARKVIADARAVAQPTHIEADLATGMMTMWFDAPLEEGLRNRIAKVITEKYQTSVTAQMLASPPKSPYTGQPPVAQQPAGAPAQPMQAPQQQLKTGPAAQQQLIDNHTDPMKALKQAAPEDGKSWCGESKWHDPSKCRYCQTAMDREKKKQGQLMPSDLPTPMGTQPSADILPEPSPGGMESMPAEMGEAGLPSMPQGSIGGEDQQAVEAALLHYRNKGMGPMEAMSQFSRDYGEFLDRFGSQGTQSRADAEAAIIKTMSGVWSKPAVLKQGSMPEPKVNLRVIPQGGSPTAPKPDLGKVKDEMSPKPGAPPDQQDMQGNVSPEDLSSGVKDEMSAKPSAIKPQQPMQGGGVSVDVGTKQ